jgi:thioredoxin 1
VKSSTLAWIAGGMLALGAGSGLALLNLSTPAAQQAGPPAAGSQRVDPTDRVHQALRAGKPTVAEFGANSCAQCREMKTVLDALRQTHGGRLAIVNVDLIAHKEADYIRRYGIQLMPTQIFYDAQGRESSRHVGRISGEEILARLQVPAQAGSPQ